MDLLTEKNFKLDNKTPIIPPKIQTIKVNNLNFKDKLIILGKGKINQFNIEPPIIAKINNTIILLLIIFLKSITLLKTL